MPFPFYWIGALFAGLVLAGALMVFGLALDVLMRATNEVRGSVLPGLVSGFREWTADQGRSRPRSSSPQSPEAPSPFEENPLRDGTPMSRVHARVH